LGSPSSRLERAVGSRKSAVHKNMEQGQNHLAERKD
jgi:hypothetical protein